MASFAVTGKMKRNVAFICKRYVLAQATSPNPSLLSLHFLSNSNKIHLLLHSGTTLSRISEKSRFGFDIICDLKDALNLFHEMLQRKPLPSTVQFNQLLGTIFRMENYFACIDMFKKMRVLGVPVDEYTLNRVINSLCLMNEVSYGFAILSSFFKTGHNPDVVTFSTLLKGLVGEGRTPEAVELFKKLIRTEVCEPDEVMYGTVINELCKTGNTINTVGLLKLLERGSCKPDTISYSLCKDRMIDEAFELFSHMIDKGIPPNVDTYSSLLQGLCNFGLCEKVKKILREMGTRKISPNVDTFTILVDTLCKEGRVEDVEEIIRNMSERGMDPNVVTFNALIHGYCLRGKMNQAMEVLSLMVERGLMPDVVSYSSLINGYCKQKKVNKAMHLYRKMSSKGLKPNGVAYNSLLQGLFQIAKHSAAQELFIEMERQGLTPNLCTYRILAYCFTGYAKTIKLMRHYHCTI